ncbi:uncharacterized protein EDB93DRAFT_216385 [Suillus bovinus]|uniref:uncharacterized protein n=1 Tax=Suillus bovinus TaxID=48563 RepID=UPI001B884162|nr:uncharacterized protein EDB93DRAFT_216385 [Suillus bovinus]KAG2127309.1 hypothetical protein EDB93DRAFT_216385 [Suillus bovinus]
MTSCRARTNSTLRRSGMNDCVACQLTCIRFIAGPCSSRFTKTKKYVHMLFTWHINSITPVSISQIVASYVLFCQQQHQNESRNRTYQRVAMCKVFCSLTGTIIAAFITVHCILRGTKDGSSGEN